MFEPQFKNFREKITKVFDDMVLAVKTVPRIETQLYSHLRKVEVYLEVCITFDVLQRDY